MCGMSVDFQWSFEVLTVWTW